MAASDSSATMTDGPSSPTHNSSRRSSSISIMERMRRVEGIDATERDEEENASHGLHMLSEIRSRTQSRPDQIVIGWEPNDPENPYNWPKWKKAWLQIVINILVLNSTMGSALPSMAIPDITAKWGITSQEQHVLPISVYLIGYVAGPLLWGPLSEHLGRRDLIVGTFAMFCIFTMACAVAPTWPALLVFRCFCGVFASAPITIVAGILADIFNEPRSRGQAYAYYMVTTIWGPLFSPILSGFVTPVIGWRWVFWIGLIVAGATFLMAITIPETYAPILLAKRARKLRKLDPVANAKVIAPRELEATDMSQLLTVVLTRPVRMLFFEPIVAATCTYLAFCYAIFYMSFEAFPIIFSGVYGLSPGVTGLIYLPIGVGSLFALPVFYGWDNYRQGAASRGKPWVNREEYRRLPLACLGGPLFVISLFWLGWTSRDSVSFVTPMLAGLPFGMGFMLIFMAMLNYLSDAYEIFSASASAASSASRSLFGVLLPLATTPMFHTLGIPGACSLLGGLSALMCFVPFIFIWKGPSIRARSPFCIALRERKEEMLRKAEEEAEQRQERVSATKEKLEETV
ncbi:Polyamine transporter 3 [Cladobotryum mycophilum]|uniref:Polyamine transporter 3 n=1 Tax=Cladobotryum mycophilum TaxID=491253 RepID=A0ABR0SZV6_9HYPO